jgi:SNF2 family DNA or RNA helicase
MALDDLMAMPPFSATIHLGRIVLKGTQFVHSDMIASIPGSKFHGKGQDYWSLPLTWQSVVLLLEIFPEVVQLEEDLIAWTHDEWNNRIEPCTRLRTGEGEEFVTDELLESVAQLCPPNRSPIEPVKRRYQVSGAFLLATAKRFLLLDEQGTGKMTEGGLTLSLYPDTLPALIVSPASTLYTWERELSLFGLKAVILDGDASKRRKIFESFESDDPPQVLICSYGMLSKHSRVAPYGNKKLTDEQRRPKELNGIEWKTVLADEVHRAKDPKADQTRALWGVSANAEYRWGFTGTPVEGSPEDFWSLLHFIDPDAWPSKTKFIDSWCDSWTNWFGVLEVHGIRPDRAEAWQKVTEWMWRRKLAENLPPLEPEIRYCELKGKQLKAYKDMERQLMAEVGENDRVLFAQNHMVKAGRLLQMANSGVDVEVEIDEETGEENVIVTPIEPSPKLDLLMDTLKDYSNVPVLIWFDKTKLMDLAKARLDAKGIPYVSIDGTMNAKARDKAVQSFQNGEVDRILLSVSAASEGITLTRAPVSIVVQRHPSLILNDQKDRRNLRIGSEIHDKITVIDLITRGTLEEDQLQSLEAKRAIRDGVIRPDATS